MSLLFIIRGLHGYILLREGLPFLLIQFHYFSVLSADYPSWSSELLAVLLQQLFL